MITSFWPGKWWRHGRVQGNIPMNGRVWWFNWEAPETGDEQPSLKSQSRPPKCCQEVKFFHQSFIHWQPSLVFEWSPGRPEIPATVATSGGDSSWTNKSLLFVRSAPLFGLTRGSMPQLQHDPWTTVNEFPFHFFCWPLGKYFLQTSCSIVRDLPLGLIFTSFLQIYFHEICKWGGFGAPFKIF